MPTSQFLGGIKRGATPDEIVDYVIRLERKLDFLLQNGLDSENIFEAGGWRIKPDQLASKDDDVGMSTTDTAGDDVRLWAGGTDKNTAPWRVTKSGKMNATGAVIESQSGYPKVVVDPDGNLIGIYLSATQYITFVPFDNSVVSGAPFIHFQDGSDTSNIYQTGGNMVIIGTGGVDFLPTGGVFINTLNMNTFSDINNGAVTLQQALNAKADGSGVNGTVYVASSSGGSPTTAITFTNGVRTS